MSPEPPRPVDCQRVARRHSELRVGRKLPRPVPCRVPGDHPVGASRHPCSHVSTHRSHRQRPRRTAVQRALQSHRVRLRPAADVVVHIHQSRSGALRGAASTHGQRRCMNGMEDRLPACLAQRASSLLSLRSGLRSASRVTTRVRATGSFAVHCGGTPRNHDPWSKPGRRRAVRTFAPGRHQPDSWEYHGSGE